MRNQSSVAIQIWPFAVSDDRLETLRAHLSGDELERADRMRVPAAARDFVAVRGAVRELLAMECGCAPRDLKFAVGSRGKPHLISPAPPVTFNLSHSGGYCALATTPAARLGVDIETIRPTVGDLAESVFTPREAAQYATIAEAERMRAFFRAWVAKEAFLKATGDGLAGGLDSLELDLTPGPEINATRIRGSEAARATWCFRGFDVLDTLVGAVAVEVGQDTLDLVVRFIDGERAP